MSLLDDVSIVVTPNGYKAGTLYGVIPVPTEGSEEVTNGDFATDSDWNLGSSWDISGGKANYDAVSTGQELRQLMSSIDVGQLVNIVFEVSDIEDGKDAYFKLDCSGAPESVFTYTKFSAGTYTYAHAVTSGFNRLTFTALNSSTGGYFSIDNVSVKEWTGADMDVTRATAATRVDENGLVNYAEVLGGEEITNGDFTQLPLGTGWDAYTSGSSTVAFTEGAILSIDGSNSNVGVYQQNIFTSGVQYKIVVSVKATASFDALVSETDAASSKGTIGTLNLTTSYQDFSFYYTGTGTWDLFIHRKYGETAGQNQQIYIKEVSVKEVTRDNVPRIDYTGGGCPHILAEPQSINLYTNYNLLTAINSGLVSLNNSISPDGTNNATKLTFGSTTNDGAVLSIGGSACVASTLYTFSFYAKSIVGDGQFNLRVDTNSQSILVDQNFTTTTDWVRYSHTFTSDASATSFGSNSRFRKVTASNEILFYGMQLEKLSYSTSIIPTSGSTVTRNQDIFTRDGIGSLINSTEGVLFVEMAALADDGTERYISLSDGSLSNRVYIQFTTTTNQIKMGVTKGGSTQASRPETVSDVTEFNKLAISYSQDLFKFYVNGSLVFTDSSGDTFTANTLNRINFDVGTSGFSKFFGKVRNLQVYKTALTEDQLEDLTS